jgi:hypothetical protein
VSSRRLLAFAAALAALAVLGLGVAWMARSPRTGPATPWTGPALAGQHEAASLSVPSAPLAHRVASAGAPDPRDVQGASAPTGGENPGVLCGRVRLDGAAPSSGGQVVLTRADASSARFPLDAEGRFLVEGVRGPVTLSLALPPQAGRLVIFPARRVESTPSATEFAFELTTRHVNLKVVGDVSGWNQATIHVEGAGCAAELETDAEGRAYLAFVESGEFRLVARHPSGRTGSADLELGPDDDLESVVIVLADPPRG